MIGFRCGNGDNVGEVARVHAGMAKFDEKCRGVMPLV